MEKDLIKAAAEWLSDGSGLPLVVRENEKKMFAYTEDGEEVTKAESDLSAEGPHALIVIGAVEYPKTDVPTFIFGYKGGEISLSEEEEDEAIIVDNFSNNPGETVKAALEYLKSEFGRPARGERPKFLVVSEFPLLAAIALGTLTWIDFYFRAAEFIPKTSADEDKLVSAFVYATTWSRREGLNLDAERLISRPSLRSMVPFIWQHRSYLNDAIIEKAGLMKALLEEGINQRKEELGL